MFLLVLNIMTESLGPRFPCGVFFQVLKRPCRLEWVLTDLFKNSRHIPSAISKLSISFCPILCCLFMLQMYFIYILKIQFKEKTVILISRIQIIWLSKLLLSNDLNLNMAFKSILTRGTCLWSFHWDLNFSGTFVNIICIFFPGKRILWILNPVGFSYL